jgi:small conductance mechanosensitive channel
VAQDGDASVQIAVPSRPPSAAGSDTDVLAQDAEPTVDDDGPIFRDDVGTPELSELTNPSTILELIGEAFAELAGDILARLPLIIVAIVVLLIALLAVRFVVRGVGRGLVRSRVDFTVRRLVTNLLRVVLLLVVILLSFSIAGVEVGAMLAALGLIGLGLALALQGILENLISGIMILVRKPYNQGEIVITGDIEGFVEDIDLRVTTIRSYDGTLTLVPNADIFAAPLTNLTRRGTRRSTVHIGIDYRDDHEAAHRLLSETVAALPIVLDEPPPQVLLIGLGDSSVDFEVRFWTPSDLPTVLSARDQALRACKTAVEAAGMTIPWPIRTLAADMHPLQIERLRGDGRGDDVEVAGASGGAGGDTVGSMQGTERKVDDGG